jgi:hypothetical protein
MGYGAVVATSCDVISLVAHCYYILYVYLPQHLSSMDFVKEGMALFKANEYIC